MTYVEGFVTPVATVARADYVAHADAAARVLAGCGIARQAEYWGDDVPDGQITDFARAVQRNADETVVFSWFEYPDRAARDAANAAMMADPRMEEMAQSMPFDGRRMIHGGFAVILEQGAGGGDYIDGFLAAVPAGNRDAYVASAQEAAALFLEHGALRVVEAWGDDVPEGKLTDFARAVKAAADEVVVFSWIEWPDRDARNTGWARLEADPRMIAPADLPFDARRMVYGGFARLPIGEGK